MYVCVSVCCVCVCVWVGVFVCVYVCGWVLFLYVCVGVCVCVWLGVFAGSLMKLGKSKLSQNIELFYK